MIKPLFFCLAGLLSLSATASTATAATVPNAVSVDFGDDDTRGGPKKPYARHGEILNSSGGTFALPKYGGFSGGVSYASAMPPNAKIVVSNAGANNAFGAPSPIAGTPILYLQFATHSKKYITLNEYSLTISSAALQTGLNYALYVVQANDFIQTSVTQPAVNGKASLSFPLSSGLSVGQPLEFELVPLPQETLLDANFAGDSSGGVYFRNANTPGSPSNFFALPNADAVAVDDSSNIYASGYVGSGSVAYEYLVNGGGPYVYYNGRDYFSRLAPGAGSNALLDVANIENLLVYPQGSNSPSVFVDPLGTTVQAVAVDGASNGYVGGLSPQGKPEVDFLKTNVGTFNLNLNIDFVPQALALDSQGDLAVAECYSSGDYGVVTFFKPGQTSPFMDIGTNCALDLAFGNGGAWLYILQKGTSGPTVLLLNYSPTVSQNFSFISSSPVENHAQGIAIDPRVPLFSPDRYKRAHPSFRYWPDFNYSRHHAQHRAKR